MKRKKLLIVGILIFLSSIISYDSVSIPEWKIRVVNEKGEPLPNQIVKQKWRDPSLEWIQPEHITSQSTDQEGYVVFPARTVNASLLNRFLGVVKRMVFFINPHASSTPYAFITSYRDGFAMYAEGHELDSQITVK